MKPSTNYNIKKIPPKPFSSLTRTDVSDAVIKEGGLRTRNLYKATLRNLPLVSIITVCFNSEKTIKNTINHVLAQTYTNVEFIVVDGGSSDNTAEIITQFERGIDYWVSEPDLGIYNAMNRGIGLSSGDYILILNSDDWISLDFVEKSINQLRKNDFSENTISYAATDGWLADQSAPNFGPGFLIHHLGFNHETALVPSQIYKNFGLYSEDFDIVSDAILMREWYNAGVSFEFVPDVFLYFDTSGESGGGSELSRQKFFREAAIAIKQSFPFLSLAEAEDVYKIRFNLNHLGSVYQTIAECDIDDQQPEKAEFIRALCELVVHLSTTRFKRFEINSLEHSTLQSLCILLRANNYIRRNLEATIAGSSIAHLFEQLHSVGKKVHKTGAELNVLSVFSAPTETFIYEQIVTAKVPQIVICAHRTLADQRPTENVISYNFNRSPAEFNAIFWQILNQELELKTIKFHFGTNFFKALLSGLVPPELKTPVVIFLHGIDVADLKTQPDYKRVIQDYAYDPLVDFVCVSEFLTLEFERQIKDSRIHIIGNIINDDRFKSSQKLNLDKLSNRRRSRRLQLLAIGRPVPFKGFDHLIHAMNIAVFDKNLNCHLTLVLPGESETKVQLKALINSLNLKKNITVSDFVNFDLEKDFHSKFDVYVMSSIHDGQRAETFGLVTAEAILAGLPLIFTEAGGTPEVVPQGLSAYQSIPEKDPEAIAKKIEFFLKRKVAKADIDSGIKFIKKRFSATAFWEKYSKIAANREERNQTKSAKQKYIVMSGLTVGGAGTASNRTIKNLQQASRAVTAVTPLGIVGRPHISEEGDGGIFKEKVQIARKGFTRFTLQEKNPQQSRWLEITQGARLVNVQWAAGYISDLDLALISQRTRLVFTIRDYHLLLGGCHFTHGCQNFTSACNNCPQVAGGIANKQFEFRKRNFNWTNISFVFLSEHTRDKFLTLPHVNKGNSTVIANSAETDPFLDQFSDDVKPNKLIKFVYSQSFRSDVKGERILMAALAILERETELKFSITIVGAGAVLRDQLKSEIVHVGRISNRSDYAKIIAEADLSIIPSLEETFCNTAMESICCGTRFVGFNTGALKEISGEGEFGDISDLQSPRALAEKIQTALKKPKLAKETVLNFIKSNFSAELQAKRYLDFFDKQSRKRLGNRTRQDHAIKADFDRLCSVNSKTNKLIGSTPTTFKEIFDGMLLRPRDRIISPQHNVSIFFTETFGPVLTTGERFSILINNFSFTSEYRIKLSNSWVLLHDGYSSHQLATFNGAAKAYKLNSDGTFVADEKNKFLEFDTRKVKHPRLGDGFWLPTQFYIKNLDEIKEVVFLLASHKKIRKRSIQCFSDFTRLPVSTSANSDTSIIKIDVSKTTNATLAFFNSLEISQYDSRVSPGFVVEIRFHKNDGELVVL